MLGKYPISIAKEDRKGLSKPKYANGEKIRDKKIQEFIWDLFLLLHMYQ